MNTRTIMPEGRFTDDELRLIKITFAENFDILKVLRKVMLQMELTEAESVAAKKNFNSENTEIINLMHKVFLPTLDGDAPINQMVDLWLTLDIKDKLPEMASQQMVARGFVIKYLSQQLRVLEGKDVETMRLDALVNNQINLMARNTIIIHVEQQLNQLRMLGGTKDETPEETVKRLAADSSK